MSKSRKKNIKDRFEKYLSSDLFHDQAVQTKSNYWNYHSIEALEPINVQCPACSEHF